MLRDLFIGLSENQLLNRAARNYGLQLGAQQVVAGTNITEMMDSVKELNQAGIACTIDNLGEFVYNKSEAIRAKEQILAVVKAIHDQQADAHISLKPSQLGLDIDYEFCREQIKEIAEKASRDDIFVNLDMENYPRLEPTFRLVNELAEEGYTNIGTVIQAYFHRALKDTRAYRDMRMRLVKGAYKESPAVAYQKSKKLMRTSSESSSGICFMESSLQLPRMMIGSSIMSNALQQNMTSSVINSNSRCCTDSAKTCSWR